MFICMFYINMVEQIYVYISLLHKYGRVNWCFMYVIKNIVEPSIFFMYVLHKLVSQWCKFDMLNLCDIVYFVTGSTCQTTLTSCSLNPTICWNQEAPDLDYQNQLSPRPNGEYLKSRPNAMSLKKKTIQDVKLGSESWL